MPINLAAYFETDLVVLVNRDGCEYGFGECEGLEDAPSDLVEVVCLDHVEARLVAVHGLQDDLQQSLKY